MTYSVTDAHNLTRQMKASAAASAAVSVSPDPQFPGQYFVTAACDFDVMDVDLSESDMETFTALADRVNLGPEECLTVGSRMAIISQLSWGMPNDCAVVINQAEGISAYTIGALKILSDGEIFEICERSKLEAAAAHDLGAAFTLFLTDSSDVTSQLTYLGRLADASGALSDSLEAAEARVLMGEDIDDFDFDMALDAAELAADRLVIDIHAHEGTGLRVATLSRTGIDEVSGHPFTNVLEAHVIGAPRLS